MHLPSLGGVQSNFLVQDFQESPGFLQLSSPEYFQEQGHTLDANKPDD